MHTPTTTLGYLRPVLRLLHDKGFDFNTLQPLQALGDIHNTDARQRVPVSTSRQLMEQAATLCPTPPLWKSLIKHTQYSDFGGLGLTLEAGGNLLTALQRIANYHALVSDALTLRINVQPHHCQLIISLPHTEAPHRQSILYLIGLLAGYCRSRSDDRFLPECIGLTHPSDKEIAALSQHCGCPVLAANTVFIQFPAENLHTPLKDSDPELATSLETVLQGRMTTQARTYAAMLQQWLRLNIGESSPRLCSAASALHMSERSLQRRLREEGVSWSSLVQSTRQQVMDPILSTPGMPITEVALTLGYTHATSFSRAFRKRYGMTPRSYRKKMLNADLS